MFYFPFIFIITIPRTPTKLKDVGIFKAATEVFGVLLNDGFAFKRLFGSERGAFRDAYFDAIFLSFSDTLTDTAMEVGDFFFGLVEGGFDLFFGKSHHKVIDKLYVAFEERIDCSITGCDINTKKVILGRVED